MEGRNIDKYILESQRLRGEGSSVNFEQTRRTYTIVSIILLIVFITGCTATYATTKTLEVVIITNQVLDRRRRFFEA